MEQTVQKQKPTPSEAELKILESSGKTGLSLYNRGKSAGKSEGQGLKKDPFVKEAVQIVNSVLTEIQKDSYTGTTKNNLLAKVQSKIKLDKDPTRNDVKVVLKELLKYYNTIPKPEAKTKGEAKGEGETSASN